MEFLERKLLMTTTNNFPVGSTVAYEEFVKYSQSIDVTLKDLTKPNRVYCDIDGVVKPYVFSQAQMDNFDGQGEVRLFWKDWRYPTSEDNFEVIENHFYYDKDVVAKLREWSERDDVDFIWLTAWRENAVFGLDNLLGIKSSGFLPWEHHPADDKHHFKGHALQKHQQESPSKFVWLDDFANERQHKDIPYFTRGEYTWDEDDLSADPTFEVEEILIDPDRYLAITTNPVIGLSLKEARLVDAFLE